MNELKKQQKKVMDSINGSKLELEGITKVVQREQERLDKYPELINGKEKELEKLNSNIVVIKKEIVESESKVEPAREKVRAVNKNVADLENRKESLLTEISEIISTNEKIKQGLLVKAGKEKEEINNSNEILLKSNQALLNTGKALKIEIDKLTSINKVVSQEVKFVETDIDAKRKELSSFDDKCNKLNSDKDELDYYIAKLKGNKKLILDEIEDLKDNLEEIKKEQKKAQVELDKILATSSKLVDKEAYLKTMENNLKTYYTKIGLDYQPYA